VRKGTGSPPLPQFIRHRWIASGLLDDVISGWLIIRKSFLSQRRQARRGRRECEGRSPSACPLLVYSVPVPERADWDHSRPSWRSRRTPRLCENHPV